MFRKLGLAAVSAVFASLAAGQVAAAAPPREAPAIGAPPSIVVPTLPSQEPQPTRGPSSTGGVRSTVSERLNDDGTLRIAERITAPAGKTVTRHVGLRFAAGGDTDRVFAISDESVDGSGSVDTRDGAVVITVTGTATVHYTVRGAVVDAGDHEEIRWQPFSGWDTPFARVSVSFAGPAIPGSVTCYAGAVGSTRSCEHHSVTASGLVVAYQSDLGPGQRFDLAVRLADGTVSANAVTATTSAFALTPTSGGWLVGVAALLIAGVALLWFLRGRDAKLGAAEAEPVAMLQPDGSGGVVFCSPDGVLPGQIGTVVDEHVDTVDVAATVLDLAVRNYLWIGETVGADGGADWWLGRRYPPDDALTAYEGAVYEAVLPEGTDHVLLSTLAGGHKLDLLAVRRALYSDVVARHWFARRPDVERSRWFWAGAGVAVAGAVATGVLALTVGDALIGVGVVVGGVALAVAARWMPARTTRGSLLVRQIHGVRRYLESATPAELPAADAEAVFSRSLPYAVVLGCTDTWLASFAELDTAADGASGLYWYASDTGNGDGPAAGGAVKEHTDLTRFAAGFPTFLAALSGALERSGNLR